MKLRSKKDPSIVWDCPREAGNFLLHVLADQIEIVPRASGRAQSRGPRSQAEKQRQHAAELKVWNPSDKPDWLTEEVYRTKIRSRLAGIKVPAIASALGISQPYAAEIRAGRYMPHPRHWSALARPVGVARISEKR